MYVSDEISFAWFHPGGFTFPQAPHPKCLYHKITKPIVLKWLYQQQTRVYKRYYIGNIVFSIFRWLLRGNIETMRESSSPFASLLPSSSNIVPFCNLSSSKINSKFLAQVQTKSCDCRKVYSTKLEHSSFDLLFYNKYTQLVWRR